MADIHVPQARQGVEVALAAGVDDVCALAADDDQRLFVIGWVVKRVDQVFAVGPQDLINIDGRGRRRVSGLDHELLSLPWRPAHSGRLISTRPQPTVKSSSSI